MSPPPAALVGPAIECSDPGVSDSRGCSQHMQPCCRRNNNIYNNDFIPDSSTEYIDNVEMVVHT